MDSTLEPINSLLSLDGLIGLIAEAVADELEGESADGDEEAEEDERNA